MRCDLRCLNALGQADIRSCALSLFQLLAVFMQLGARDLLMHYIDLKQTNDVQLTFEALKVTVSCGSVATSCNLVDVVATARPPVWPASVKLTSHEEGKN